MDQALQLYNFCSFVEPIYHVNRSGRGRLSIIRCLNEIFEAIELCMIRGCEILVMID